MCKFIFVFLAIAGQVLVFNATPTFGQQPADSAAGVRHEWSDSVSVGVEERGWRFVVELYKPKTAWCEPIFVRKKIENIDTCIKICPFLEFASLYSFESDMSFIIKNAMGERMRLGCIHVDAIGGLDTNRLLMEPGDTTIDDIDLLWLVFGGGPAALLSAYPPGKYTADISLYLDPTHRAAREENTLILPQLTFEIVEPTGDSATALRLLAKALNNEHEYSDLAEACFDSIFAQFSHTPYEELAYIKRIAHYTGGKGANVEKMVEWSGKYFLKYHKSPSALINANRLIPRISRERMKELVAMIQNKPGTAKILQHLRDQNPWIFEDDDQ